MLKKKLLTDKSGDLQEQILEAKAREMVQEMDREILWSMLASMGWHRVMLPVFSSTKEYTEIAEWTNVNCKRAFEYHKRDYLFEDEQDAMWFKLRWLG